LLRKYLHFSDFCCTFVYNYLLLDNVTDDKKDQKTDRTCLEVTHINGKYILNSMNANYSYGMLQKVFELEFKKINLKNRKIDNVLILGFGAGSVAYVILEKLKMNCHIIGVEKDSKVISLGYKYFNTQRFKNTEIVCADAYDYLMENKKHFDLIIVDVYIGNLVPEKMESAEFIDRLKNSIKDKGMVIFNKIIFDENTEKSSKKLYDTFSKVMGQIQYHKIHKHHTNLMLVYENDHVKPASKTSSTISALHRMF
jgi:spermidine synthase